ncbi:class I SAM-dependent methyltransferase [Ponticoccus sp. SC2-23]|uniref:class I SAM-dependent methyltransferase n=1 Tax=Alexandriicola marinus TaxID=2081710 RepID=UPI0013E03459|nr:class I SAM-dependent methyltransferase [Alexandriicola marinus]MBM1222447.1 class I SAM-dependent methyltransferase [Ponticoccus sp. SC6-9]MBM1226953.1 class I SAM-dependent methyltransferase [Ponticoccus sp. SC6-15]MBM1231374.1 class I SAM-dependent methyltransferase [Ponticoccus sp. SC6-38]MBM1235947.1 class I SAM-dependent methyltransferase [Ponticoccus sp. SC6-45]MBM1240397.1 class I SAM-dependent methyltransferase [Ponticoccus sp. SC6-49]MBM1244932.1 class I SAM-dependent methyltrans
MIPRSPTPKAPPRPIEERLLAATNLAGTFYAPARGKAGHVREAIGPEAEARPWAARLPPTDLRHYYGLRDGAWRDDLYLSSGASDVRALRRTLALDGVAGPGPRILDFGCGAGRMTRHLGAEAATGEVWGVDIHAEAIRWAQTHLPPFHFVTTTTAPHLPFEDRSFDLVFASSVWTHIGDLDDAWLLEVRRLLKPGGRLYFTISDAETLDRIAREAPDHASNDHVAALDAETGLLTRNWRAFITRTTPWKQRVVYDRDDFLAHVARWMELRAVIPGGHGWQTAILLAKPEARS